MKEEEKTLTKYKVQYMRARSFSTGCRVVTLPSVLSSSVMAFSLPHCHEGTLARLPLIFFLTK